MEFTIDLLTVVLFLLILVVLFLPALFEQECHPLLLAQQSCFSNVRLPNESAVYRNRQVPPGLPLTAGLQIHDIPKNSSVKDIWELGLQKASANGSHVICLRQGRIEQLTYGQVDELVKIFGSNLRKANPHVLRVGICLPNSLENFVASMACSRYGFVCIPISISGDTSKLIQKSRAEILIIAAGVLSLENVAGTGTVLEIIQVDTGSEHMDWDGKMGPVALSSWSDYLNLEEDFIHPESSSDIEMELFDTEHVYSFTRQSFAAAVSAQLVAIRYCKEYEKPGLMYVEGDLSSSYGRVMNLVGVALGATLFLVSSKEVLMNFKLSPSIWVMTSPIDKTLLQPPSLLHKFYLERGRMPPKALCRSAPKILPSSVRLLQLVNQNVSGDQLNCIRSNTGARVVSCLTVPHILGPIAQTVAYDYRPNSDISYGPPTACIELKLFDLKETDSSIDCWGKLAARGTVSPDAHLSDGWLNINICGKFREDGCLIVK